MSHDQIIASLEKHAINYKRREHAAVRTVADVKAIIPEFLEMMVKTIAFRIKNGEYFLAAARGADRIDYKKLAQIFGAPRRDVRTLSPDELSDELEMVVGGVTPVPIRDGLRIIVDSRVAEMETISVGGGLPTVTLELQPSELATMPWVEFRPITKDES